MFRSDNMLLTGPMDGAFCNLSVSIIDIPGDLLDDVADESGALGEVALGAGNTGLGLANGDLLCGGDSVSVDSCDKKYTQSLCLPWALMCLLLMIFSLRPTSSSNSDCANGKRRLERT